MKKFFLFLLILAGSFCGALKVSAAWAVTDTIVADGYYYIRLNYCPDATPNPGCVQLRPFQKGYVGWNGLHVKNMTQISKNDLNCIWHIWRDAQDTPEGHPQYHIKNCGLQSETYAYPHRPVAGQSDYIYATGTEQDTYMFQTKSWGYKGTKNSKGKMEGTSDPWKAKQDRQDVPWALSAENQTKYINSNPDSMYTSADKCFFIQPRSTRWRWRLGGDELIKVNSFSTGPSASFFVTPICADSLPGGCIEWLQLIEAITDAKGYNFKVGVNPGNVNSEVAMEAFESVLDEAYDMQEAGATVDEYKAERTKVLAAIEEVKKYVVPLDGGYFYLQNGFGDFGGGTYKFAIPFNEYRERYYTGSSTKTLDQYADDCYRNNVRSHRWHGETYWYGYKFVTDPDYEATTAEGSNLPDAAIWRIEKQESGNYLMKSMAKSSECGDSTYAFPYIRYTANVPLISAWCQLPMRGTPQNEQWFMHCGANSYRIYQTDNLYPLNMGNHFFNTQNPVNSMTYGLWYFHSVPAARITPKFKLNGAITDAGGVFQDWRIGDGPYEVKETYVADLRAKLAEARALYDNPSASDADCNAMTEELEALYKSTMKVLKDTDKVQNPLVDGYYFIESAEKTTINWGESHYYQGKITTSAGTDQSIYLKRDGISYYDKPAKKVVRKGATYHMYATDDNQLLWNFNPEYIDTTAALDYDGLMKNPEYVKYDLRSAWKIEATGNKSASGKPLYTAKNLATGGYFDMTTGGKIYLSEKPTEICFQDNLQQMLFFGDYYYQPMNLSRAKSWLVIMNPDETRYLRLAGNHAYFGTAQEDHTGNNYAESYVVATSTASPYTVWYEVKPIEQAVVDSFLALAASKRRAIELHNLLGDATSALANASVVTLGDSLITDAGQTITPGAGEGGTDLVEYDPTKTQIWMNNNQWGEGDYANLIDGNLATYVQSRWSTDGGPNPATSEFNAVIVDLKTPKSAIAFKSGARGNANIKYGPLGQAPITYGVTDYGERYRFKDYVVYATNDTTAEWEEVAFVKNVPAIKDQRVYTSPLFTTSTPYRYFKFAVQRNVGGQNYLGHPHIAPSYFQVFDASIDEANSATGYDNDVKTAAATLKALVAQGWDAYKTGIVPAELNENIKNATDALNAIAPNSWTLLKRLYEAKALRDSTYAEDEAQYQQYGDVTTAQKAAFEAAIDAAEDAIAPASHPTPATLQAAYDALNEAYWTLNGQRKTFETDTWYYMTSTEYQAYCYTKNFAWRGNNHVYACGDIPQDPLTEHKMGNIASPVRWGHYTDFRDMPEGQTYPKNLGTTVGEDGGTIYADYTGGRFDDEGSPYSQWRIVQLGAPEDSLYAIQNRANGLYIGRRQDYTDGSFNYVTLSKDPMPVQIVLLGRNQYEILPVDSTCGFYAVQADKVIPATGKWPDAKYEIGLPFHAQGSDFHQVWWGTGTERGYNTGSAYTFSKGTCDGENELDEDEMLALPTKENSIKFMTLPYYVDFDGGIITEGQDAHSYVLKNIDTDPENYKVELTEQFAFKAGEPFILVTGDPQPLVTESQDSTNIYVDPAYLNADGYDFNAVTENGLVGVMFGDSIKGQTGLGVDFGGSTLLLSKETETYYIPGHGAYINPTLVADAGGKADKVIGGLIDAIKTAVAEKEDAVVNVFTADGKLVKSGVKRSQAKAGLAKGIYLIGKNKVMVR